MKRKYWIPLSLALLILLAWAVSAVLRPPADARGRRETGAGAAPFMAGKEPSALFSGTANAKGNGAPRIFFPEAEHDFGRVIRGENVTHAFKVRNTGEAPLRLISAKGS